MKRLLTTCVVLTMILAASGVAQAVTIDGISTLGEWDGATSIPVASGMGTVYVYADTAYLYAMFNVTGDTIDGRVEYDHGEKLGININPSGTTWGTYQCDLIFQIGMNADAWGGTSAGAIDGFAASQWNVGGTDQTSLPAGLVTATRYDTGHRVTELMMPLDTIAPSLGDTLRIGGAVDFSGMSYRYPVDLDWLTPATYVEIIVPGVTVVIDIKPGSYPNSINLKDQGILPVAILGSSIDVSTIDLSKPITLGGTAVTSRGPAKAPKLAVSFEDVDEDGFLDLVAFFRVQDLVTSGALDETTTELMLEAETTGGVPIQGTDTVNIVPPEE